MAAALLAPLPPVDHSRGGYLQKTCVRWDPLRIRVELMRPHPKEP